MRASFFTLTIGRLWDAFQRRMNDCAAANANQRLRRSLGSIGSNVQLSSDTQVEFAERIRIGDYVYVGPRGQFFGRGGLTIADHVIIGPQVTIMTSMHNFKEARFIPYDEVELLSAVEIGEASWIGLSAILMGTSKNTVDC